MLQHSHSIHDEVLLSTYCVFYLMVNITRRCLTLAIQKERSTYGQMETTSKWFHNDCTI